MKILWVIILPVFILISCSYRGDDFYMEEGLKEINGTKLYYKILGEGEPIVIVHGGPGLNHAYLLPHLQPLSEHFQLIFYDQRVCGRSSLNVDTNSISLGQFVEDIEQLRKTLSADKINLMAHSWGGLLAMKYAIKYQENLNSLILVNANGASSAINTQANQMIASRFTKQDSLNRAKILQSEALARRDPDAIEALMKVGFKLQFHQPAFIDSLDLSLNVEYAQTSRLLQYLSGELSSYDFHDELRVVKSPALLIYGDFDPLSGLAAEGIHSSLVNSELLILEDCGHFPFIEKPKKFVEVISNFINASK